MNQCRFCDARTDAQVKYGVRHYAHFKCYLDAGKKLSDLHAWQVGEFPFRLLKERGLEAEAYAALAEVARASKPTSYFNVTLDAFDGRQYGMLTLCVEADTEDEAKQKAVEQAQGDGAQKVKVMFVRVA